MKHAFLMQLQDLLRAESLADVETLQELWSGYGTIKRYSVQSADVRSIIVKHVRPPRVTRHPRGWDSKRSHLRKLKSYQVESAWYRDWAQTCGGDCRMPRAYALREEGGERWIALEDLDASGFSGRVTTASRAQLEACVKWLAAFHASFLGVAPKGLWTVGTYWHLETRPDELAKMQDERLRGAAAAIDQLLSGARFRSVVHGDAKLANFCFSDDGASVAAVDFQYVGGGCGMKDLAYLMSGALNSEACQALEQPLLDLYFEVLRGTLADRQPRVDAAAVEAEWRALYAPAWADFYRFLRGWSPEHWKLNGYGEELTQRVLREL